MSTQVAPLKGYDTLATLARRIPVTVAADRFLFVRHGETEGNRTGVYQIPETPLNAAGEAQAVAAGVALKTESIRRMAASPMARAWRTAEVVAAHHGVAVEPDGALAERLFMGLAGQPVGELDWAVDPPGCERLATFVDRCGQAMARHLAEHDAATTALVAHGGVLLVLLAMLDIDPRPEIRRNAVPLRFVRAGGGWRAEVVG